MYLVFGYLFYPSVLAIFSPVVVHKQNSPRNLENADTNQGDLEDVIAVYQTGN